MKNMGSDKFGAILGVSQPSIIEYDQIGIGITILKLRDVDGWKVGIFYVREYYNVTSGWNCLA